MPPTMVAYPPKVALNLEKFSAHRIMSLRLMKLYIFEKNLTPPPLEYGFGVRIFTVGKSERRNISSDLLLGPQELKVVKKSF